MSFSLNYFDPTFQGTSYLSNGLIGINISFAADGMTVQYQYSNEMLDVNFYESQIAAMEHSIRNSWIRQYNPEKYQRIIEYVSPSK